MGEHVIPEERLVIGRNNAFKKNIPQIRVNSRDRAQNAIHKREAQPRSCSSSPLGDALHALPRQFKFSCSAGYKIG